MTAAQLSSIFRTPEVREAIREIDAAILDRQVNGGPRADQSAAVARLRVAAIAAFSELLGDRTVDSWLREDAPGPIAEDQAALECFTNWDAYLDAVLEVDGSPPADDLLFFSVAGFLARRPHEVRDALRRATYRRWLDAERARLPERQWIDRVRCAISVAVLLVVRQDSREDILAGGEVLRELAAYQREIESGWLGRQHHQRRDSLSLLGFYYLAHAVTRTSEFLLAGSVTTEGRGSADVIAELRRLLVRAEEFLAIVGDGESSSWLVAASIALVSLRASSVWVQSRGISERIDRLLGELTQAGRPHPVFSLLPSQQEALRQAFLDRSRVAIVLQMPTSAGKTLLAEFAIAQTFDAYRDHARIVYLVPTRALGTQVRRQLAEDLGPLQIRVSAAGSAFEEDPFEMSLLEDADGVVIATPEKLDLMLRAHPDWFESLRLVVVDEAHLLSEGERGVRLELLLANLRREAPDARLLLLTPFMDNANQVASWLSRERGHAINVQWRPSRVLLGMAEIAGARGNWSFNVSWTDPYSTGPQPKPLVIPTGVPKASLGTNTERVLFLGRKFNALGTLLALFSASPAQAEKAAQDFCSGCDPLPDGDRSPQLRLAIALSRHEFGLDAGLPFCLERGVAFHHSSLSPILRYLIEDQIRAGTIRFVAATSTLAQGMNFPVATVLVHSVHKPRGGGNFSSAEFWNMAGRAGRLGLVERGLVIFADPDHRHHMERYAADLRNELTSALLAILPSLRPDRPLKEQYRDFPALRPFIQYLAHAAATSSAPRAIANLEELIQQSLVNQQVRSTADAQRLRTIARSYLQQIVNKPGGMLKAADVTGLATFSFDELYAKLREDPILRAGPREVLRLQEEGFYKLLDALRWIPELDLAIGFGEGDMDVRSVAKVVQGWVGGQQIHELASHFPGDEAATQRRKAGQYVYGTVSQTMSWGTHAYLRGWLMGGQVPEEVRPEDAMLPAYVQYGVQTAEAAVAALLGVPRPFAEAVGQVYRERAGALTPDGAQAFRGFVEDAGVDEWRLVIGRSGVADVQPEELRKVYRQMHGLHV